jgi:hypothetical protein
VPLKPGTRHLIPRLTPGTRPVRPRLILGSGHRTSWLGIALVVLTIGAGCAPAQRPSGSGSGEPGSSAPAGAQAFKRVAVVVPNEPPVLYYPLAPLSTRSGGGIFYNLLHPGVAVTDNEYALRPLMVEEVPSLSRGDWRLLPDGGMVTLEAAPGRALA